MLFFEKYYPNGTTFQQDGAPAHYSKHTKEYLMMAGLTEMSPIDQYELYRELLVRSIARALQREPAIRFRGRPSLSAAF